jgi:hypothetical protein
LGRRQRELGAVRRRVNLQGGEEAVEWPTWWLWELDLTSHVKRRMEDRDFTEIDLRSMLHRASGYRADFLRDRWVIESRHRTSSWEVIVEPDEDRQVLVVITAYPVGR